MDRVVHCRRAAYDVYIGRPSIWGNPFSHLENTLAQYRVNTREEAIKRFRSWFLAQPMLVARLPELKGKILGCWCAPQPCHGHVLVKLADGDEAWTVPIWQAGPEQRLCAHQWLVVPGAEIAGIQHLGYWLCSRCRLQGLNSNSRTPTP